MQQALQEVWLDPHDQIVVPTYDADFYAAWGQGEIKRVLRLDPTPSSLLQVIKQFFHYYKDHALAHRILNILIMQPDAQAFRYSVAYGQDQNGHVPSSALDFETPLVPCKTEILDRHRTTTALVFRGTVQFYDAVVNALIAKILQPDDAEVLKLLRRPSQTLVGNVLRADDMTFSVVLRAMDELTKWMTAPTTIWMTAKAISTLLRNEDLGFLQQDATLVGKPVVCLGGPADPTWVDDAPDLMVVGKDVGWRAIAKPWTIDVEENITVSCKIGTAITNPRAYCVVTARPDGQTQGCHRDV